MKNLHEEKRKTCIYIKKKIRKNVPIGKKEVKKNMNCGLAFNEKPG